ncbi:C6 finger domain-containing protein [Colletotrichum higginsianum IMI 349063]|uniref:C6 finger domain-containing protein n=1 Tax=Colletotrichum higginsianum (strain IMI 349063) TaxID=759273 RepID=A0A1B7YMA2_COLHI|nr:C6 finger domain-containing protein [Colletotrichum higginsianum IMI 349063]OBR13038.1 C6 finger domain-containing protein [Colletotrichum higginsianum IMI 349063]
MVSDPVLFTVDSNSHAQSSHNSSGSSRRSACDRCRAHKLRCVRPSGGDFIGEGNETTLLACERCVKAGAECLRMVRTRRAPIRTSGYEQRLAHGPFSPTTIYKRPGNANRLSLSGAGDNGYRDSGQRAPFPSPASTQHPDEGRIASQLAPNSVPTTTFQHNLIFEPTVSNAVTLPPDFHSLLSTESDLGPGPNMACDLGELDPDMTNSDSTLEEMMETEVRLAHRLRDPAGDVASSNNSSHQMGLQNKHNTNGPPNTKNECLNRLARLNLKLLECLSAAEDQPIALEDILAYTIPCTSSISNGTAAETMPCKNIIGILLESSQAFLEILVRLRTLMESQEEQQYCYSSSNSDCSYLDSQDVTDFFSNEDTGGVHEPLSEKMGDDVEKDDRENMGAQYPGLKTYQSFSTPAPAAANLLCHQSGRFCSSPATFTIMTCYLWLFHGFEVVFAAIHDALLAQQHQQQLRQQGPQQKHQEERCQGQTNDRPLASPLSPLSSRMLKGDKKNAGPLVLPDIRLGGFHLDGHPHLQIEMLIHLSCQILHRIETTLGIDSTGSGNQAPAQPTMPSAHRESGLLDPRCTPAFLLVFMHGARVGGENCQMSARSALAGGVIKNIRGILDSSRS